MAPVNALSSVVARPQTVQLLTGQAQTSTITRVAATSLSRSQFSTSTHRHATPSGPPPAGFRLPKPKTYAEGPSAIDKAGNYFMLTEIFRGMYVVLEQYFRPP